MYSLDVNELPNVHDLTHSGNRRLSQHKSIKNEITMSKKHSNLNTLAGEEGFEPSAYGFGDRRSTN